MEDVLEVYCRPYDERHPVVCLDEKSKQLTSHVREPLPMEPGKPKRVDDHFRRGGTCNLFLCCEPLRGWRHLSATERRTRVDWAECVRELVDVHYPEAEKVVLILDNLNTHQPASLYEAFPPAQARRLWEHLEIHYTPKHGSWLNMAECELSALGRQCLNDRLPDLAAVHETVAAWEEQRNRAEVTIDWRFTTADARIKLKRLYPQIHE